MECFRTLSRIPSQDIMGHLSSQRSTSRLPEANPDPLLSNKHVRTHPVETIRSYLSSRNPNDHYLFMSCLDLLHVSLWAGNASTPTLTTTAQTDLSGSAVNAAVKSSNSINELVLEQWEVERIMSFLTSGDRLIWKLVRFSISGLIILIDGF